MHIIYEGNSLAINRNIHNCLFQREVAKNGSVPENVWTVFENAISDAEAGLTGWIRLEI